MKILAFAASNSRQSINRKLVGHAADVLKNEILPDAEVEIIDLNDFEMPLYSIDRETADGVPPQAKLFREKIAEADALLVSYAEHNGSYSAAFKNIFDWASRLEGKVYDGKRKIVLATSPGPGGAASVLGAAVNSAPFFGAEVKGSLSVPLFGQNFDAASGVLANDDLAADLRTALRGLAA